MSFSCDSPAVYGSFSRLEKQMKRLYEKLAAYEKSGVYPFHMPGHKRNQGLNEGGFPFGQDITEITGFDNLHHAEDIIAEAQERAAELYGARETCFSVNGSTAALLAAVSAAVRRGGKLLTARNCHKSIYHALYLRDLTPVYVYPQKTAMPGLNGGISPDRVRKLLDADPEIGAAVITSPTYDGVVSDVRAIAEICHSHGIPLIVDEAHGAHFVFSSYFPESALQCGADVVVQSVHKTLPSLTQTALLHFCSDRVDHELTRRFLGMYETSSPSYILMASIDACMHLLERQGETLFHTYTAELEKARRRLEACRNVRLLTPVRNKAEGIFDFDRSRILLGATSCGLTGTALFHLLREKYLIEPEMDGITYVLALSSVGDTKEGFDRLCSAMEEIDAQGEKYDTAGGAEDRAPAADYAQVTAVQRVRIAEAMEAAAEFCPLEESIGRISAEFIYFYPPGIPLIVPGEEITAEVLQSIEAGKRQGLFPQGMSDTSCRQIRILSKT